MFDDHAPGHAAHADNLAATLRERIARNAVDEIGGGLDWLTVHLLHDAVVSGVITDDGTKANVAALAAARTYADLKEQSPRNPDLNALRRAESSLVSIIECGRYNEASVGLTYIWLSQVYHQRGWHEKAYAAVERTSFHLRSAGELSNALASLLYIRLVLINQPNTGQRMVRELKGVLSKLNPTLAGHVMFASITRLWLIVAYRREGRLGHALWHAWRAGYGLRPSRLPADDVALDILPPFFEPTIA